MEPRMTLDPIHQFNIDNLFKIGQIGNQAIYFTNSSVYMLVSVVVICVLMVVGVAGRQLVPGRFQAMAEVSYEFVASMVRSNTGPEGMRFFRMTPTAALTRPHGIRSQHLVLVVQPIRWHEGVFLRRGHGLCSQLITGRS